MKEIKFLLLCLAVALYTSSWWACAMFGWILPSDTGRGFPLVMFPALFTFLSILASFVYLSNNWDKK